MIGLDDKVLSDMKKKENKEIPPTFLYQEISTMKEFKLSPAKWFTLSRIDKKILYYYRVMESYYIEQVHEKHNQDMKKQQQKQEFMNKLPKQQMQRRGR